MDFNTCIAHFCTIMWVYLVSYIAVLVYIQVASSWKDQGQSEDKPGLPEIIGIVMHVCTFHGPCHCFIALDITRSI